MWDNLILNTIGAKSFRLIKTICYEDLPFIVTNINVICLTAYTVKSYHEK